MLIDTLKADIVAPSIMELVSDKEDDEVETTMTKTRTKSPKRESSKGAYKRYSLTENAVTTLITLIEHLGSMSISVAELKSFMTLLRTSVYGVKGSSAYPSPIGRFSASEFIFPRLLHRYAPHRRNPDCRSEIMLSQKK